MGDAARLGGTQRTCGSGGDDQEEAIEDKDNFESIMYDSFMELSGRHPVFTGMYSPWRSPSETCSTDRSMIVRARIQAHLEATQYGKTQ